LHRTMRASPQRKSQSVDSLIFQATVIARNGKLAEFSSPQRTSKQMDIVKAMTSPPLSEVLDTSDKDDLPRKPEKRVSFSSQSECHIVPQRTERERNHSFNALEDYVRIWNDNDDTIQKMLDEEHFPVTETIYYRGLEVPRAKYEREQRVKFVVSNVLREQEKRKMLSPQWVQHFSSKFSSQTARAARYLGQVDARAAGVSSIKV
jgi:hypothetical protein